MTLLQRRTAAAKRFTLQFWTGFLCKITKYRVIDVDSLHRQLFLKISENGVLALTDFFLMLSYLEKNICAWYERSTDR